MIPERWRRGEVAVIGLARTGIAVTRWLAAHGVTVYASDIGDSPGLREAAATLTAPTVHADVGRHDLTRIRRAEAVIVSPGVPPSAPPLRAAREAGVEIIAELDLAARALTGTRLIVVTGTNGKSTTTALIGHLLQQAGFRSAIGGNIGRPLISLATDTPQLDWIAVEASSFQLHDAPHLAPAVGVLTNLAPDHLDRYATVADYYADKRRLFQSASPESVWVLNADDAGALGLARDVSGRRRQFSLRHAADASFDRRSGWLLLDGQRLLERADLPLLGEHNVANALAAALAAAAAGVGESDLARGLATFRGLPHRLEVIREVDGVTWINDSKATNVASARVALEAITTPFVLIAGGRHKGESYAPLAEALGQRCRAVVAYGEAGPLIARDLAPRDVSVIGSFTDALQQARRLAQPGETVLLSPAGASYDQFTDYEQRGATFRRLVEAM